MKVLVIGSGGREHALLWKLAQSPSVTELYAIPGNGGTENLASSIPIGMDNIDDIVSFAQLMQVDLTVAGPETVLTEGIADRFRDEGLALFGPSQAAARIEGSKSFAKEFMKEYHIPTAEYAVFDDEQEALAYAEEQTFPLVIKADGLAGGKGVVIVQNQRDAAGVIRHMMEGISFGNAGRRIVIEEFMQGEEVSVLAFCDGHTVVPMVPSQDHKRVGDGDTGPNTGGMGAYAPAPVLTPALSKQVYEEILTPAVEGMRQEGFPFRGCLYAGLMITDKGPRVVEFNCRFGDPETQAVLPLLDSDLAEVMMHCVNGTLSPSDVRWKQGSAVCVVMAASGYPYAPASGDKISGISDAEKTGCLVFQAGTVRLGGEFLTDGGRVLDVVGTGKDLSAARDMAYQGVVQIRWGGEQYRHDIAQKGLDHLK